ncbi:hypothetical protein BDP27DRAFT_159283 [Rhodocollybia butyracea]|uniref:C2H2-type domain-containing protein n=1 Tax=Rhodocollybia butyracea TaxID=206335 RepID=A0A9P5PJH1_9AGAR|nr:hypothetical protein BDP27DRAFT_159283 [Rhodocollybia butyracea]
MACPYHNNPDLVSSFQWNFCSNFVCICCYTHLPSLHDLYDHVEEAHLSPYASYRSTAWPPKVPLQQFSRPRSPPASPGTDTSLDDTEESSLLAMAYPAPSPIEDLSAYEDTLHMNYFTTSDADILINPLPRHPLPASRLPAEDIVSAVDIQRPITPESESEHERERGYIPRQSQSTHMHTDIRSRLRTRQHDARPFEKKKKRSAGALTSRKTTKKARGDNPILCMLPPVKKRAASKKAAAFKCPKPGCIKAYRNTNGLKYHLDKGACVIEYDSSAHGPGEDSHLSPDTTPSSAVHPPLSISLGRSIATIAIATPLSPTTTIEGRFPAPKSSSPPMSYLAPMRSPPTTSSPPSTSFPVSFPISFPISPISPTGYQ